jgi:putative SOS response-associated peptidase YedK
MMRWGLIPSWAEGQSGRPPPVIVEQNEIQDSPMFRAPWLNSQRCILPIAGFYAWQRTNAKYRQPFFITLLDRRYSASRRYGIDLSAKRIRHRELLDHMRAAE